MPPVMPRDLTVAVRQVSRRFGEVHALTDLTIEVPTGAITVLLGPNGAGKTTAIRMITGALGPDSGSVEVFGTDPSGPDGLAVRRRCGVVSAKPSLYDRLDGWDNMRYAAELYGLGRGDDVDGRIREAAARFGIEAAMDQMVGGFSTGMKTRLALARSVLHQPDLLLLDEPTSGLDPESAVAVLQMIRQMTDDGRTVLMCTHLLLEAEGLADQVVVMEHGSSLVWGAPDDLARQYWPNPTVRISSTDGTALQALTEADGVLSVELDDVAHTADAETPVVATVEVDRSERTPALVARLVGAGVPIASVVPFDPTLEDLYFAVRRTRGQPGDPADGTHSPPPLVAQSTEPSARARRSAVADMAR